MTTEVAERHEPLQLIALALEKGADPEKLERLFALQEKWLEMQAKERFGAALAAFQSECPQVPKTRAVNTKAGGELYRYAGLEDVMKVAQPLLSKHGIVTSTGLSVPEGPMLTVSVFVRVGAYQETRTFDAPKPEWQALATAMHLTVPQAYGLVLSYYRRYGLCAALGITVCGEDSDAAAEGVGLQQPIGEDDVRWLREALKAKGADEDKFLRLANVQSFDEITLAQLPKCKEWVTNHRGKGKEAS